MFDCFTHFFLYLQSNIYMHFLLQFLNEGYLSTSSASTGMPAVSTRGMLQLHLLGSILNSIPTNNMPDY